MKNKILKHSWNFYVRKTHRYLGVFIGIQFLLWTIGGFYFSWMNIKGIRGEDLVKPPNDALYLSKEKFVSPNVALAQIQNRFGDAQIAKIQMTQVLQKPYYEITASDEQENTRTFLVDAVSGSLRENLSREEAIQIARNALNQESELVGADYLTSDAVGSHHEYRGQPLPAWAVNFRSPKEFVVYVAAESGKIEAVRTRDWRIFDFLWMLHTMDYYGRDDINNYALRAFSILGLLTISSGFVLFAVSSPYLRKIRRLRK